jgi:hypothetical protein
MLKNSEQVQMWVQPSTRDVFKQIGQATGESQHEIARRLAEAEQRKLERKAQKGGGRA